MTTNVPAQPPASATAHLQGAPREVAAPARPSAPDHPSHPLAPLAQRRGALDPQQLTATAESAARALLRQGEASNTRRSYGSAMRYWCAWYAARYGGALTLPVPVPVVVQFIVDHAARRPDVEAQGVAAQDIETQPLEQGAGPIDAHRAASQARPAAAAKARARRASAALVTELPNDVDEALVKHGYKGKLGPPTLNTLVHRLAVLSKAHQMASAAGAADSPVADSPIANPSFADSPIAGSGRRGLATPAASTAPPVARQADPNTSPANPCADPLVRELLARTRRAYAQRGAVPKRQRALTRDPLQLVLATCDESLKGKRDRALLLFAWASGGRRRSEVAGATLENLQRVDGGAFLYTLTHSKTNQRGDQRPEDVKPLVGSAAAAMREWLAVLQAHGIKEGAIFRRIRRGSHLGEPLAAAAVRDIVRERCALAGVEGSFSAHSLRAGFVTEAGRQNLPLPETMAMTGHQSVATVVGYFRAESTLAGKAGRMLEEG